MKKKSLLDKSRFLVAKNFSAASSDLRKHFEQRFAEPRQATADRFVWDYWHVPEQYTLLRTPAASYFPAKEYRRLLQDLLEWGQSHLGCDAISPPWLSLYVEGCRQELHADLPHGPWAFVLSLTRKQDFLGGETQIVKPEATRDSLYNEIAELSVLVPPDFNQLLAFDPSLPHGVRPVNGVRDPLKGRLVLHGWFTWPQLTVSGGLSAAKADEPLSYLIEEILEHIGETPRALYLDLSIESGGRCKEARLLWWRTKDKPLAPVQERELERIAEGFVFPATKKPTRIGLPVCINFF